MKYIKFNSAFIFLISFIILAGELNAQEKQIMDDAFIQKGKITTSLNFSGINGSEDRNTFSSNDGYYKSTLNLDALYFLSSRIGVGPIIGLDYTKLNYKDGTTPNGENSSLNTGLLVGIQSSYYLPAATVFKNSDMLSNVYFFGGASVSRYLNESRFGTSPTNFKESRWGYGLNGGILFPVGNRIGIEAKLQWTALPTSYNSTVLIGGDVLVPTTDRKIESELSIGIGFKFAF